MFDSTFFKFLAAFIVIIGLSLAVLSMTGGLRADNAAPSEHQRSSSN